MKRLRWSQAAARDLDEIALYLDRHHPAFAQSTLQRLYDAALRLKRFPELGRIGRVTGTRELYVAPLPYFISYIVDENAVHLLRILHTSREMQ